MKRITNLLHDEIKYLNIDTKLINYDSVEMKYLTNFEEYDNLLMMNIVFIDLFDAAANNAVLECIVRNTPIIVRKLPAIVEYLGNDYPLYFNKIGEAENLLLDEMKIKQAHNYLINMNKNDLTLDYFTKKMITASNA